MFVMLQQIKDIFYNLIVMYLTSSQTFILLVSGSSIDPSNAHLRTNLSPDMRYLAIGIINIQHKKFPWALKTELSGSNIYLHLMQIYELI